LPSSPFLGALAYIRERRAGLSVYLDDPDVAIDTNHLERALRLIPINAATGCSHGPNWVPSMSASSRAYWSPAACTTSIRTTTLWMYYSASGSIRRHWYMNSRYAYGQTGPFSIASRYS